MFILIDKQKRIVGVSDRAISMDGHECIRVDNENINRVEGKFFINGQVCSMPPAKPFHELRVAMICNWNDQCGISTYSKYLYDALKPKVKEIAVFSECVADVTANDESFVTRCWKRGERLKDMVNKVRRWEPDFVIIQHEFGIFPNATHFFQMMQMLEDIPYALVMHSVYEHQDKAVYASVLKNIIVHSEEGKQVLKKKGLNSRIFVVPHGCVAVDESPELWNILTTPYTIMQFGFGFRYKGVERMLEAVSYLVKTYDKYRDLFYTFFLSSNQHNGRVHEEYYEKMRDRILELGIEDNAQIIRGYNSEQMLQMYLKTYKLAVFPYETQPDNSVYGASGAIRFAMASGIPVIASNSHLFDDLQGVVPRPDSTESLAKTIGKVFSDGNFKQGIVSRSKTFMLNNSWDITADRYLQVYLDIHSVS